MSAYPSDPSVLVKDPSQPSVAKHASTAPTTDSLSTGLFGPLDKQYCLYFYILSVIGFVMFFLVIGSGFYMGLSKKKPLEYFYFVLIGSMAYLVLYFQNRLLYSMCSKSL